MITSLDKEAPILICPTNQTFETDSGQPTAVVVWTDVKATDNSGENLIVTCNSDSGSQFEIGLTEIVCEAWDLNRNHAMCTFTVYVKGKSC